MDPLRHPLQPLQGYSTPSPHSKPSLLSTAAAGVVTSHKPVFSPHTEYSSSGSLDETIISEEAGSRRTTRSKEIVTTVERRNTNNSSNGVDKLETTVSLVLYNNPNSNGEEEVRSARNNRGAFDYTFHPVINFDCFAVTRNEALQSVLDCSIAAPTIFFNNNSSTVAETGKEKLNKFTLQFMGYVQEFVMSSLKKESLLAMRSREFYRSIAHITVAQVNLRGIINAILHFEQFARYMVLYNYEKKIIAREAISDSIKVTEAEPIKFMLGDVCINRVLDLAERQLLAQRLLNDANKEEEGDSNHSNNNIQSSSSSSETGISFSLELKDALKYFRHSALNYFPHIDKETKKSLFRSIDRVINATMEIMIENFNKEALLLKEDDFLKQSGRAVSVDNLCEVWESSINPSPFQELSVLPAHALLPTADKRGPLKQQIQKLKETASARFQNHVFEILKEKYPPTHPIFAGLDTIKGIQKQPGGCAAREKLQRTAKDTKASSSNVAGTASSSKQPQNKKGKKKKKTKKKRLELEFDDGENNQDSESDEQPTKKIRLEQQSVDEYVDQQECLRTKLFFKAHLTNDKINHFAHYDFVHELPVLHQPKAIMTENFPLSEEIEDALQEYNERYPTAGIYTRARPLSERSGGRDQAYYLPVPVSPWSALSSNEVSTNAAPLLQSGANLLCRDLSHASKIFAAEAMKNVRENLDEDSFIEVKSKILYMRSLRDYLSTQTKALEEALTARTKEWTAAYEQEEISANCAKQELYHIHGNMFLFTNAEKLEFYVMFWPSNNTSSIRGISVDCALQSRSDTPTPYIPRMKAHLGPYFSQNYHTALDPTIACLKELYELAEDSTKRGYPKYRYIDTEEGIDFIYLPSFTQYGGRGDKKTKILAITEPHCYFHVRNIKEEHIRQSLGTLDIGSPFQPLTVYSALTDLEVFIYDEEKGKACDENGGLMNCEDHVTLSAGDVIVIKGNQPHSVGYNRGCETAYFILHLRTKDWPRVSSNSSQHSSPQHSSSSSNSNTYSGTHLCSDRVPSFFGQRFVSSPQFNMKFGSRADELYVTAAAGNIDKSKIS